jgi:hypothetical protein
MKIYLKWQLKSGIIGNKKCVIVTSKNESKIALTRELKFVKQDPIKFLMLIKSFVMIPDEVLFI